MWRVPCVYPINGIVLLEMEKSLTVVLECSTSSSGSGKFKFLDVSVFK